MSDNYGLLPDLFVDHLRRYRWIVWAREDSLLPGERTLSEIYPRSHHQMILRRRTEHYEYLPAIILSSN